MKRTLFLLGLIAAICLFSLTVFAAPAEFTYNGEKFLGQNIGETELGSAKVDGSKIIVTGCGADVWGSADAFYYVYKEVAGDFEATLKVSQVSDADPWAKIGIMARVNTEAGAPHAFVAATNENNLCFQRRPEADGESFHTAGEAYTNGDIVYLKLVRKGEVLTAFTSFDNKEWTQIEADEDVLLPAGKLLLGVAHTSHNAEEVGQEGISSDFAVK